MAESIEVGNPIPVLNLFHGLLTKLHAEATSIGEVMGEGGPISKVENLKDDLVENTAQLLVEMRNNNSATVEKLLKVESLVSRISTMNAGDVPPPPSHAAMYASEIDLLLGEVVTFWFRLQDDALRFFIEFADATVLSDAARWSVLESSSRLVLFSLIREIDTQVPDCSGVVNVGGNTVGEMRIRVRALRTILTSAEIYHDTLINILNKYDYPRLFAENLAATTDRVTIDNTYRDDLSSELLWATSGIRRVLIAVSPRIVLMKPNKEQTELIAGLKDVGVRLELVRRQYYNRQADDGLHIADIGKLIEASSFVAVDPEVVFNILRKTEYRVVRKPDDILSDIEEVRLAYGSGAFKLATVGCGGILEVLLRELLHQNTGKVEVYKSSNYAEWKNVFDKSSYGDENNIKTWSLFSLVEVASLIFDDGNNDLRERCSQLRRARNRIHGGRLEKPHADISLDTLRIVAMLI